MTISFILAFCFVISYLSFRNQFFGLKLMAGASWFALFIYLKDNPLAGITEGDGTHVALLVITIGIGLMIVLSGLGRGISRSQRSLNGSFEVKEEGEFGWKLPGWLNAGKDDPEKRSRQTEFELEDYRDKMQMALRTGRYSKRRR